MSVPEFVFSEAEKSLCCILAARMDSGASNALAENLDRRIKDALEKVPDGLRVVFDMGQAEYVASAFFRICLQTVKKLGEGNFTVINCKPLVQKTFAIAGLDKLIAIS